MPPRLETIYLTNPIDIIGEPPGRRVGSLPRQCMCVHVCVHVHACAPSVRVCMCEYKCVHVCACMHMYACIRVRINACARMCAYIRNKHS